MIIGYRSDRFICGGFKSVSGEMRVFFFFIEIEYFFFLIIIEVINKFFWKFIMVIYILYKL